ncbi:MAG: hypothetical protein ABMA01_01850, partial [Chthoniobacteraceae bacterium]
TVGWSQSTQHMSRTKSRTRRDIETQYDDLERYNHRDNSLVRVPEKELYINARRVTGFKGHDRVLFVVLARLAQTNPGRQFSGAEVLDFISKHQQLLRRFNSSIPRTLQAIYSAATKLRKVLEAAGVSPNLFESNRGGDGGYRLSIPSINVSFEPPWEEGGASA